MSDTKNLEYLKILSSKNSSNHSQFSQKNRPQDQSSKEKSSQEKYSCSCDKNSGNNCNSTTKPEIFSTQENQNKEEEKSDPTRFNDWQINCRTIDF